MSERRQHSEPLAGTARPLPPPGRIQELLFDAARLGRADMIQPLVRAGADLEAHDPKGYSALILATYHGSLETTQALLDAGAYIDGPELARGNTALMGVAFKGYAQIVACLLGAGARVDRRNRAGQTALMMAALFGHAAIVEELIEAGADPALEDAAGNSAGSLADQQGNGAMRALIDMALSAHTRR
jgi:ankyrin repeat protein